LNRICSLAPPQLPFALPRKLGQRILSKVTLGYPGMSDKPTGMRYWWVNQNQTYRHEVEGGYLWSPKRNANGGRNPFYESMREVAPGDLIFSFMDTRILAVGIAQSY
jgi:hypothetical protein